MRIEPMQTLIKKHYELKESVLESLVPEGEEPISYLRNRGTRFVKYVHSEQQREELVDDEGLIGTFLNDTEFCADGSIKVHLKFTLSRWTR